MVDKIKFKKMFHKVDLHFDYYWTWWIIGFSFLCWLTELAGLWRHWNK